MTDLEEKLTATFQRLLGEVQVETVDLTCAQPFSSPNNRKLYERFIKNNPLYDCYFKGVGELVYMFKSIAKRGLSGYVNERICDFCHNGLNKYINYTRSIEKEP